MPAKEKDPADTLYVGERVVDTHGNEGIVVQVESGVDDSNPGFVAVWQKLKNIHGDNCETYSELGWRKSLKRVGPEPTFLYAIRDKSSGRYYKTHTSNRGAGWVKEFEDARTWTTRGQARSKATSLGSGTELVEFVSFTIVVHDQAARLRKLAEKKARDALKRQAAHEKWAYEQAKQDAEKAAAALHAIEKRLGKR